MTRWPAIALVLAIACSHASDAPDAASPAHPASDAASDAPSDGRDAASSPDSSSTELNGVLNAPPPVCLEGTGSCASAAQCFSPFRGCALSDDCLGICTSGAEHEVCFRNSDCIDALLCGGTAPEAPYPGTCRLAGTLGAPCVDPTECTLPSHCTTVTPDFRQCSDGSEGSACGRGAGCASSHCVAYRCTSGAIDAPCATDADCDQGYCAARETLPDEPPALACTAGIRLDPCMSDDQCLDGFCVAEPSMWGECQPGQLGQPCLEGSDCHSESCAGVVSGFFGACADGTLGSPCEDDAACASTFCVANKPPGGTCTTGEPGAQCVEASDCLSASCVLQPGGGLPGTCQP